MNRRTLPLKRLNKDIAGAFKTEMGQMFDDMSPRSEINGAYRSEGMHPK